MLAALRAKGRDGGYHGAGGRDRDGPGPDGGLHGDGRGNCGRRGSGPGVIWGNPKNFGNQLKYADKRSSPVAVIQGGNEAAAGTVILKDLVLGAKIAESATLEEWKDRPAQVEVPREGLVAAVRKMLGQ